MPFMLPNPVFDEDGNEYPFATMNLITRPDVKEKYIGAPTVVNLRAFRVLSDGTIIQGPDVVRPILMADAYKTVELKPHLAPILGAMMAALQELILAEAKLIDEV